MEELFRGKEECCGCSACMSACPVQAITMKADEKGFWYPQIDKEKCVDCGRCKSVCPLKSEERSDRTVFRSAVFAVKNKDEEIRKNSSSGGGFYELGRYVFQHGGVVYGAGFDENFQVVHIRGTAIDDLSKMQGSKYVQSNTIGIFESVKDDLKKDKMVLFTGCPCQIDGLKQYLRGSNQDRLLTCDLLCHGVNSPQIWQDYLAYITKNGKIVDIHFRDKTKGWRNPSLRIQTVKRKYREIDSYDYFFQAFYGSMILRDSCFACKYASLDRNGDITLGDFWGVENAVPELDDNKGVSLVLLNTRKGHEIFSQVEERFIVKKTSIEKAMQPSLRKAVNRYVRYEEFWQDYLKKGFPFICKKYLNGSIKGRIKKNVRKCLVKMGIWENIKRLLNKS